MIHGPNIEGDQFHKLVKSGLILSTDDCDCCFLSSDNEIVMVVNSICKPNDQIFLIGYAHLSASKIILTSLPSILEYFLLLTLRTESISRNLALPRESACLYRKSVTDTCVLCAPLLHDC